MRGFVRVVDSLSTALAIAASALLSAAVLIVTYMVVNRSLGGSSYWEIEFSIYLMVAAVFLGSPYCLATKGHVGVDLLGTVLPKRAAKGTAIVAAVIGLATCFYLAWIGFGLTLEAFHSGERSQSLWRPVRWPLYATMPAGLGLTVLQYVAELIKMTALDDRSAA